MEEGRERERESEKEAEGERELHACCESALSVPQSVSQSACVIIKLVTQSAK